MAYHLLTGATGLLGGYLLRDGLQADLEFAVVVRPSKFATARQRVDDLLLRWERQLGCDLPRPPVLEGDISEPGLGLSSADRKWVADHCESVVHNAASLMFEANETTGEPRRSNVEGTRNVLELCHEEGIRKLHYVSTAYICGLRQGRVLETELDVGQRPGNAYEETKLEAEKMVAAAGFLDSLTVYRPAIIIGDSQSGYTTTYHGFYTPLRIAHGVASRLPSGVFQPVLLEGFGLQGHERKNFVPVDWVARVMTHILRNENLHGATYHLTPANTVDMAMMYRVMLDAVRRYSNFQAADAHERFDISQFTDLFRDQLTTYQSYWRDDPEFDLTNTRSVAGHLPCPEINEAMLMLMCQYAIEKNFGWPREIPLKAEFDVEEHLRNSVVHRPARVGLDVTGAGGLQCTLHVERSRIVSMQPGVNGADSVLRLNSGTYRRLLGGELSFDDALRTSQVVIKRLSIPRERLSQILAHVFATAGNSSETGDAFRTPSHSV